jgi:hypothetical protein
MAEFTEKNYSKFFGKSLLRDVLTLDPDLVEEIKARSETNQVVESFDTAAALALDEVLGLDENEINALYEKAEESSSNTLHQYPILHNFLHHLCAPWMNKTRSGKPGKSKDAKTSVNEADFGPDGKPTATNNRGDYTSKKLEKVRAGAAAAQASMGGNPYHHIRQGFHKAFETDGKPHSEAEMQKRGKAAQSHFRKWMHTEMGSSPTNTTKLLGQNTKTKKSSGEGVYTKGISMAPSTRSGYKHNICPKATKECDKNCLGVSAGGNRQYPETAMMAKIARTRYIHEHPEHAAALLSHEVKNHEKESAGIHEFHIGDHKIMGKKDAKAHIKKHGGKIDKAVPAPHKSGIRLNVTSDIPYEHMLPKHFFDRHKDTQFYDYTKIPGRLHNEKKPDNYHLSLSHTGANHPESNDKEVVDALKKGHVVASVHHRGKNNAAPTHYEDVQSGQRWKVANGDDDDNTFDRHQQAGLEHNGHGHGKEGVVSGLALKGVNNEAAGKFANKVHKDKDGNHVVYINHPKDHPDHWSHHPEDHEEHYKEHPEHFSRPHKDESKRPSPFKIMK